MSLPSPPPPEEPRSETGDDGVIEAGEAEDDTMESGVYEDEEHHSSMLEVHERKGNYDAAAVEGDSGAMEDAEDPKRNEKIAKVLRQAPAVPLEKPAVKAAVKPRRSRVWLVAGVAVAAAMVVVGLGVVGLSALGLGAGAFAVLWSAEAEVPVRPSVPVAPVVVAPVVDAPVLAEPVVDAPVVAEPVVEAEGPKVRRAKPKVEPVAEPAPVVEAPVVEVAPEPPPVVEPPPVEEEEKKGLFRKKKK